MADKQPEKPKEDPATVPDPPEEAPDEGEWEDVDELDDVLDEFTSSSKPKPKAPAASSSSAKAAAAADASFDQKALEQEMAKLFSNPKDPVANIMRAMQAEGDDDIANLMTDLTTPDTANAKEAVQEMDEFKEMRDMMESPEFAKEMENFMSALQNPQAQKMGNWREEEAKAAAGESSTPTTTTSKDTFQDTLRRTMNRLRESNEQADAAAGADTDLFNQMGIDEESWKRVMAEAEKFGMGMDSEEGIENLLKSLLGEMTDKDVLYEPMKELGEKYPAWLEANKSKLGEDEFQRYEAQARRVAEITTKFEEAGYSDGDPACRAYIMKRMEEMQEDGNHPEDLVGGLDATQQAFEALDAGEKVSKGMEDKMGCPQQ